ncbi:hypothetical protein H0H93_005061, partial [Arthromyces matolae]
TISIPSDTDSIIVLAQLDSRRWSAISGRVRWSFDFHVSDKKDGKFIASSSAKLKNPRSVNAEVFLKAGTYVVH